MLTDEDSISTEEKIKQLIDSEQEKSKEVEEKKAELDKKKKELEQLETKRKKESETTRKEIEDKIEELSLEEKKRFEELEDIRRRREAEAASLEESIEGEARKGRAREVPRQRMYGEVFDEILRGSPTFYDITNYNVMNRLEALANETGNRTLTKAEKEFVSLVQYHAERLGRDDFYKDKDESNYLMRELSKIEHINKMAKDASRMKREYEI